MANDNYVEAIVQLLIDHPKLERYYHADVSPDRKPLVISLKGASVAGLTQLRKFDMPVKVLSTGKSEGPVLSLRFRKVGDGLMHVDFSYDVEGIAGSADFSIRDGKPVLGEISISER